MAETKPREYRSLSDFERWFSEQQREGERKEMFENPEKFGVAFADELLASIKGRLETALPEACSESEAPQ